jgi:hypothetical protein
MASCCVDVILLHRIYAFLLFGNLGAVRILARLGSIVEASLGHIGASWRRLGASWRHRGAFWKRLGGTLERRGAVLEAFWSVLEHLGGVLKRLGAFWSLIASDVARC